MALDEFFKQKTVITECPDKKVKTRAYMQRSLRKSYEAFIAQEGKICSYGTFCMRRPKTIKPYRSAKAIGCLCEVCENARLKVEALKNNFIGRKIVLPTCLSDSRSLSNATLCDAALPDLKCLERKCENCGVEELLDEILSDWIAQTEGTITYFQWSSEDNTGGKKRTVKKPVEQSPKEYKAQLTRDLQSLSSHLFNAHSQNKAYEAAKALPDTAVAVFDFAENFTIGVQREIQSHHWHHQSVTLHPVVMYHPDHAGEKVRVALDYITDCKKHSSATVSCFLEKTVKYLAEASTAKRLIIFSDGCAGQYKGKTAFYNLSVLCRQPWFKSAGMKIEWHFYGSRHGKGESDGESGCVKSYVDSAIRARGVILNSAEDFANFVKAEMSKPDGTSQRHVIYVDEFCIDQDMCYSHLVTIPNTRKIHAVKPIPGGMILHKRFSCFCEGCESNDVCSTKYAENWQKDSLIRKGRPIYEADFCCKIMTQFHNYLYKNLPNSLC